MNGLAIRTPEGIEFTLPLAGPFSRMMAVVIDMAVVAALGQVFEKLAAPLVILGADFAGAVKVVAYFAISILYAIAAEWAWRGQTVGKRLFGLRVVDASGLRLEPAQVVVRNLLRLVDMLPVLYLVGGISCVLSGKRQRLGDLAAGTVVVRTRRVAQPDLDQIRRSKYNSLAEYRHLAARLRQKTTPEVARIALEALLRRDQLTAEARLRIFGELAAYFRGLAAYPPEIVEALPDEAVVRDAVEVLYQPQSAKLAVSARE